MPQGARSKLAVGAVIAGVLCGPLGGTTPEASAGPASVGADLNAEQRALIEQLTADKAIAIARERRLVEADEEKLYDELQAKDRAQRVAERHASGNAAELARIRRIRDQIAAERQALVIALGQRDQALAAEVRAYREAITEIATSPDPRKQKALQRFAEGEQREALADLDAIADANRAARAKVVEIVEAAERRSTAELALQAHGKGTVTLQEVVLRYERLTRLDRATMWDWIQLARLYDQQGRPDDARTAIRAAYRSLITLGGP
jgi:hypothetical protein